mmetsp:Transcript_97119/g.258073  ORF Transcript_97119/g.258073 Transcript_97119/m.258073 type:complete len:83 (+) Transcript_97119:457-705(+)
MSPHADEAVPGVQLRHAGVAHTIACSAHMSSRVSCYKAGPVYRLSGWVRQQTASPWQKADAQQKPHAAPSNCSCSYSANSRS